MPIPFPSVPATIRTPLWLCVGMMLLSQCAPTSRGLVATQFHNVTSHYNCWWIANEQIKQVHSDLASSHQNNFNRILQVFPEIDSSVIKNDTLVIADAIKKASIGITRHPYSNWTDDNYVVVGQSRMFMADFTNAIETFKYVNTSSEDTDTKHQALVLLMRTFVEAEEYDNAIAVSDFLSKQELNKANLKSLYLTRAHMYQRQENIDGMVENLVLAEPLLKRSDDKARILFIIGQVYQQLGLDAKAYYYYDRCAKANPEYELFFYARLNMNQVAVLEGSSDLKRVRKYYRKLLKDEKNIDFQDKIYYEMGRFEQKQGNLDEAIEYYQSSAASSTNNPRQKSFAYWELGKIFFDERVNYPLAKAYYDSTVAVMPEDEEAFPSIKQRQEVLAEFIEHITVIQETDSVIALANMDSVEQVAIFDRLIDEEEAAAEAAAKEERRRSRQQAFAPLTQPGQGNFTGGPQAGSVWYFYNPTAITSGQAEFRRRWGDRPLENNWRRKSKGIDEGGLGDQPGAEAASEVDVATAAPTEALSPEQRRDARRVELRRLLPLTQAEQKVLLQKLEYAFYRLGNIYRVDLEQPPKAISPFESLLVRFDTSGYVPEVLYQLYLIYASLDADKSAEYKNRLITEHPNSLYAKVLLNPNYLEESNAASAQAQVYYQNAYRLYDQGDLKEARGVIRKAQDEFPENDYSDNLALLLVLIDAAENNNLYTYRFALEQFKTQNPDSELLGYADQLLASSQAVEERIKQREANRYIEFFEQEHYFLLVYEKSDDAAENITRLIDQFNQTQFPEKGYTTSNLILSDQYNMVLVSPLPNQSMSKTYYQAFIQDETTLNGLQRFKFYNFVITKDNFSLFLRAKNPDSYKSFFQKHYLR